MMHPSVFNLNQDILLRKPNHQSDQQTLIEIILARFILVVLRIKLTINMLLITLTLTGVPRVRPSPHFLKRCPRLSQSRPLLCRQN